MSKDIALNDPAAARTALARPARTRDAAQTDPGRGSRIHEVSFTARGYTYDKDIPTAFRVGASQSNALVPAQPKKPGGALAVFSKAVADTSPKSHRELAKIAKQVIASGARQLEKPRRSGQRVVQRRIGWQATPALVVITTAERELVKGPDGKYRPHGEWMIEHRQTFRNEGGPAHKRTGTVAMSEAASPTITQASPAQPAPGDAGEAPGERAGAVETFPEGEAALSFLPPSVRSSAIARIPQPTAFDGTVLQYADAQTQVVDRQEINVLRMDAKRAVVIQASRKPQADAWEVSQATYTLGEPEIEQA